MSGMLLQKYLVLNYVQAIRKQYNRDFISLMPTNLYGPFDNFDLKLLMFYLL